MQSKDRRITGHVRVEDRKTERVWVAAYVQADGSKTRKVLGPAWVRDTGKTTPRGAPLWRAASGAKPDATYLTPKDADDVLAGLLAAEKAKGPTAAKRARGKTLGDAAASWLKDAEGVRDVAPSTLAGYRVIVGRIYEEEFPQDLPLSRLTPARIRSYQDDLLAGKYTRKNTSPKQKAKPLGRESVRRRMTVLRRITGRARDLGWMSRDPFEEVDVIGRPPMEPDFNVLSPSEVEAVARAVALVPDDEVPTMRNGKTDERALASTTERRAMWSALVRVAAYTGLRLGELRSLRWRDVDFSGQAVRVVRNAPTSIAASRAVRAPKSGKSRSVPLIPQAMAVLDDLKEHYPNRPDDLVFPTQQGGLFEAGRVRDAFYRGLASAGLGHLREKAANPMTFHDLRHTFGTLAVQAFPVTDVQAMLGHADVQTTMRYVHSVPRTDAAQRLAKAFDVAQEV
jgi:integrase